MSAKAYQCAIALLCLISYGAASTCGPSGCYPASCQTPTPVDFVFAIDTSASMVNAITGVQTGCVSFANNIGTTAGITPRFALVVFSTPNTDPTLQLQLTTSASNFINQINKLTPNSLVGWRETGLETIRCITQNCVVDNMNIAYTTGSQRVLLLFTDEDSDPPNHAQNSAGFEQETENDQWCPPHAMTNNPLPSASGCTQSKTEYITDWSLWQAEITATANDLIAQKWSVYLNLNNIDNTCKTCCNFAQYGNPNLDVQNSDYTNFNAAATLANLQASYAKSSLQSLLLQAGITARSFYVYNAADSNLIKSFFTAVGTGISTCNSCYSYQCSSSNSAVCLAPQYICDCAGQQAVNGVYQNTLDKNGQCCPTSQIDCAGVCYVNGAPVNSVSNNPCGICGPAGVIPSTCVQDCTGTYYSTTNPPAGFPHKVDNCGQCISNAASPPQCVKDCTGTYKGAGQAILTNDKCGICGGNNAASEFDACGVCVNAGGNGLEKDPCGNCPPSTPNGSPNFQLGNDACGHNLCNASRPACNTMCNGQQGSPPYAYGYDQCGDCVPLLQGTGTSNNNPAVYPNATGCVKQCDGTNYNPNSALYPTALPQPTPKTLDPCGICYTVGSTPPTCVQDCHGVYNGNANYDSCGQCVGDGIASVPCLQDCNNTYYLSTSTPPHVVNGCGVCRANTTAGANQDYDKCGKCVNGVGYNSTAECLLDCSGSVWYLVGSNTPHSIVDDCGQCIAPNNLIAFDADRDLCGVCWPGGASNPNFNSEVSFDTYLNVSCGCNAVFKPCPAYGGVSICADCPANVANCTCTTPDSCGRCQTSSTCVFGNPYYNYFDACGQCCNVASPYCTYGGVGAARDFCGRCLSSIPSAAYPYNETIVSQKTLTGLYTAQLIACPSCPGYTVDCTGVCNGTCANCTSSGKCAAVCGNGIVETGEACDDGTSNGKDGVCSSTCTIVSASDTGAIIGGVIGGIAALAVLALLAFLLYQYAVRNGLMGFGNAKADMGSANVNPMYKQQTNVSTNPLYQNV